MGSRIPGGGPQRASVRSLRHRVRALKRGVRLRDEALAAVAQAVFLTDSSLPENPIVYVNPAFERLTGYDSGDLVGQSWRCLRGPATDEAAFAKLQEAERERRDCTVELACQRKDGTSFWGVLRLLPLDEPTGPGNHFLGVLTDTEERRHLEDQLRQAQKMATLGRLAAGVAHDFNNLLTSILGNSELLLIDAGNPASFREGLLEIKKAGDRAAALTRQLLHHSRKQVIQPQAVDLNAAVAELGKLLSRLVGENIELVTVLDPAARRVWADLGQTEQVLLNLVANARDAMSTGGKLTITTANVWPEADALAPEALRRGPRTMLAVSDTGCGMDARTRERLFEPFFTTKDPGKGTGLGLATVQSIVQQSGGQIEVESEVGTGTTFRVYLPHASEAPAPALRRSGLVPGLRGTETVLLVEDDEPVRSLIRNVLQHQGYRVLEARDGEEAVQIGEHHAGSIDLLVTDVVLPRLSGPLVAEGLGRRWPGMRVLYASGYLDSTLLRYGVLEPGRAFLPKPFTVESFARKVREVLDREVGGGHAPEHSRGKTVLLVEDDAATREALADILQNRGYTVSTAADGREALARLRAGEQPVLILLDLMMPVMDGWEFRAEQLRDTRWSRFPVVVLSASGDIREKAAQLKAAGYLQKPVQVDELMKTIGLHAGQCAG